MNRTFITLSILAFLGFACQSSIQKKEKASSCLRINISSEPQSLDPRKVRASNPIAISQMLFEGLTRTNRQEQTELALADSVQISSDSKTYTFHLKKSQWSNGDPLSASDFVYAWKKILSPGFPSDTAFQLYVIKNAKAAKEGKVSSDAVGVFALDPQTLVVQLENPTPYFLDLLTFPAFFPVDEAVDRKNPLWAHSAETFVSNGPFQIAEWHPQDHLLLTKNALYWDAAQVKLSSLLLAMVKEETELKMFEKKELDWAGSPLSTIPLEALAGLKGTSQLKSKPFLGTYFIRTNTGRFPFNHPLIRKAFALAIDRKQIVDHVLQGGQIPATGLVPPSFGLQKQPYFEDSDRSQARRFFDEGLRALGVKRENLPEVSFLYSSSNRTHAIAQTLQQQWFEVFGIRVKLEALEGKVYMDRISKEDFSLAAGAWMADFKDPVTFLDVFKYKKGGSNNTLWESSRYAGLLDRAAQTSDPGLRTSLLAQSEQVLIEEMPLIPVFHYNMLYLSQPQVKDVVVTSMGGIDFKWATIEKTNHHEEGK